MLSVIKKFFVLLDVRQKRRLGIIFILMVISAFLEMLGVSLVVPLISVIMKPNVIETNKMIKWVYYFFNIHSQQSFIIICIIVLIAVLIFKNIFLVGEYYIQSKFVFNNQFLTQRQLLSAFMNRPYEYYLDMQSGELLRVIQNDVLQTYTLLTALLEFATESIVSVVLFFTLLIIEPAMTFFLTIIFMLVGFLIVRIVKPILQKQGIIRRDSYALAYKWLLQAINGIKEIKVTQKEVFFETKFGENGHRVIRAENLNSVVKNIPRLLIEMTCISSILIITAVMIYFGRDINSLVSSLGAFVMAAIKLMPSSNRIVGALNSIAYYEPALDKVLENLEKLERYEPVYTEKEKSNVNKGVSNITLNKNIILSSIIYRYPNSNVRVLNKADMCIPIGKSVGIVGVSGAGKTTVVDIMLGLLIPQEGQVLADGVEISENYSSWFTHIGYIPQSIFMLDDSIRNNVAFGLSEKEIIDEQVWYALEEAQLADYVNSLPEGINTQIGERGVRLSGGQCQRIGIARALYTNPELIIFDEATSALDNDTETAIMESINNLHGKKTMVIIAHRLQTLKGCDIIYRVENGKIIRERYGE